MNGKRDALTIVEVIECEEGRRRFASDQGVSVSGGLTMKE